MSSSYAQRHLLRRLSRPCSHMHGWQAAPLESVTRRHTRSFNHTKSTSLYLTKSRSYRTESTPSSRNASHKSERKLPSPTIRVSPHKRDLPASSRPSKNTIEESESSSVLDEEAILAAEARDATLRRARIRRSIQREEQEAEAKKQAQEKKDFQERYKTNSRKWTSSMIAAPIILVTSYYLIDRLAFGNVPKMPTAKSQKE